MPIRVRKVRLLLLLLVPALLALVAVLLVKTFRYPSKQLQVAAAPDVQLDVNAAAEHLAQALRFQTISNADPAQLKPDEFLKLHEYLAQVFPRTHAALTREVVGGYSLLYKWPGQDEHLKPILLLAHMDVVPVEPGTEAQWTQPPFAGRIADGYVWGRGAIDDKAAVVGILEAVEKLLSEGYRPRRTIYLAFGHDEELGGPTGAPSLAALLDARGVTPEYVLDEGGAITEGILQGVSRPVAVLCTGEKGFVSVELTVAGTGGHSSAPPPQTAIGILSAAVGRLETEQMPAALKSVTQQMFDYIGPEMNFLPRVALANLWLTRPLVVRQLARKPATNAFLRTTTAATIFEGGVKDNVLPTKARAVVNFRILPGDTVSGVLEHVRRTVNDPRVQIEVLKGTAMSEPSPISGPDATGYRLIERTIRELFPTTVVAPSLVIGATDARHYTKLCPDIYRFSPILIHADDLERIHGTNERLSVENFAQAIKFYRQLIRNSDG
ncbi:MAG TPA: M20 family peptidase [Pyrinomonadaceae bacterium]|jgi:carboxypeptidase PM20D1